MIFSTCQTVGPCGNIPAVWRVSSGRAVPGGGLGRQRAALGQQDLCLRRMRMDVGAMWTIEIGGYKKAQLVI